MERKSGVDMTRKVDAKKERSATTSIRKIKKDTAKGNGQGDNISTPEDKKDSQQKNGK